MLSLWSTTVLIGSCYDMRVNTLGNIEDVKARPAELPRKAAEAFMTKSGAICCLVKIVCRLESALSSSFSTMATWPLLHTQNCRSVVGHNPTSCFRRALSTTSIRGLAAARARSSAVLYPQSTKYSAHPLSSGTLHTCIWPASVQPRCSR